MFRLALIQMRVDGGQQAANLKRAGERIAAAAGQGAKVVLLPEAMNLGWTHPSARMKAEQIPAGESVRGFQELARRHQVYLCAGLVERAAERIYNAAVLIGPDGELLLHHRKIHELELARDLYEPGDRLAVAQTELGVFGVIICADAFAPGQVISRTLGVMGAQLILSPCAWAVPADHDNVREPYGQLWLDNYGPVARDFKLWIAGVSNVGPIEGGPWEGRRCIGCSLVVGPDGEARLRGRYGDDAEETLLLAIDLAGGLQRP